MQTLSNKAVSIFILSFLLLSFNFTYSQNKEEITKENYYWATVGVGLSSIGYGSSTSFALNANITYQFDRNILSLRVAGGGEVFGKSLIDYGLLYGYSLNSTSFFLSIGAGLAIVFGIKDNGLFNKGENIGPTVGLPIEAQLFWRPLAAFGLGLYFFADVNTEDLFAGATLSLQFGKLR
ncbi:MAG: hypothetical protein NTZ27_13090 [Ignavibacteriales bacterium]|nr:hypothetical protein [Ignavibacteriales bacterium]